MSVTAHRAAAVVGLTAAFALALAFGAASSARADTDYRFWHFNACGSSSDCPNKGEDVNLPTAILNSVESFHPHAVSLNEICKTQFDNFYWGLNFRGNWPMHGRWVATKTTDNNCKGDQFGNGLLTRQPIVLEHSWPLSPTLNLETRRLLCVVTDAARDMAICTVHIIKATNPDYRGSQVRQVMDIVDPWVLDGIPVVLMGDFNLHPDDSRLDRVYDASHPGSGYFQEVDENHSGTSCRCGEDTRGDVKLDYIFVSSSQWKSVNGDATQSAYSDHDPLRGWATLIH